MSFYKRMYDLLDKLEKSIDFGRFEWIQSEQNETVFILDLSKTVVHMDKQPSRSNHDFEEDTYDYIVRVYSKNTGALIEEFDDISLTRGLKQEDRFTNDNIYIKMREIYSKVRRKVLGSDELISSIFDDLGY